MPKTLTAKRCGTVAPTAHWLSVLVIAGLLISGFSVANAANPTVKLLRFRLRAPRGSLVLALTLVRIAWWWRCDSRPAPVDAAGRGPP